MAASQYTVMSRPSLGHRCISEQAPLCDPSANPLSGTHLRGAKTASGAPTCIGAQLPYSPLLPLPPASNSKFTKLRTELVDAEQSENLAPHHTLGQHCGPVSPSALASRRQARRGVSESLILHSQQMKHSRTAVVAKPPSALGPKSTLRLDISAASNLCGQPAVKSAGMIRSYSVPVATQEEYDEQQRIMALGVSSVDRHAANSSWWQYGWPSPGGVNHRHVHRVPAPAVPEFLGESRPSSQTKLSTVITPRPAEPSPNSGSPAVSRPSGRNSKTHSSCSPKMKSKHLPGIHQPTFQHSSSRSSASSSPKLGRSPLSVISVNLPSFDQQQSHEQTSSSDEEDKSSVDTPAETDAFDIEMDTLNQRFAEWSRYKTTSASPSFKVPQQMVENEAQDEDDYFNLVHDHDHDHELTCHTFLRLGGGSDTSDEARTPRASSPRPLSKAALHLHNHGSIMEAESGQETTRWSGSFDFIHPDHLL
ncbi:uncharacterized protein MEPE_02379 [Melanopsichium pennsylvanicum]|uniref:Uncharacterized protein n=2 Tax=Melanopsichium pennsylvanicum TaxID=63383 RepID=A0AAJ5C4I1_9BASI|nr:putative protein [Melanopsichium pennsylvanicum 4]SNX83672.1 uncharacterized protein MEPE_02379 [Melanopsichium pennsylvanicum]